MSGTTDELEIAFDADNHYWEASDAFTRHRDPAFAERGVQVQEIDFNAGALDSKYVDLTLHAGAFVDVAHTIPRDCCVGNKLIQAPPYNIGLGFNWRVARTGAGDLHLLLDGNAYGKQYFDAFNTERLAQDAYLIGNARVSLDPTAKRGLSVGVWIKNLADRKYLAYGLNQADNDTGLLGFTHQRIVEPQ